MEKKVRAYIQLHHMIEKDDRIVIGVSGGADSVALLLLLNRMKEEYNLSLFVVHINHGIRIGDAEKDAIHVETLCKQYQIPYFLFEANIPQMAKEEGKTEEEMGREYRYLCFSKVMKKENAYKLAVAHHEGDQAETVLFHLIRGSNLAGMTGIRPVSDAYFMLKEKVEVRTRGKVIRPLLCCSKHEILQWLLEKNIGWQEDITNQDNEYARNKLRNQIFPMLEEINEQAIKHVAEFADTIAEYQQFFHGMVRKFIEEEVVFEKGFDGIQKAVINREKLKKEKEIFANSVIYEVLICVCGRKKDITKEHIDSIYKLLDKQSGKRIQLPYEVEAEISYENLQIGKDLEKEKNVDWEKGILLKDLENGKIEIALPKGGTLFLQVYEKKEDWEQETQIVTFKNNYTKFFDCDRIKDTLQIRTPQKEDFFVMNKEGSKKKLSRYFIDKKIPIEKRKDNIVVANDHEVLWIVGERRCENYRIEKDTKHILEIRYVG